MLFNSIDFAIFMPIVFIIYWAIQKDVKIQNLFLLSASWFFYAWWDWRYLLLILLCSVVNYSAGILLSKYEKKNIKKIVIWTCCLICFGILGLFKYYDFFVTAFTDAFTFFGVTIQAHTLNLVLPVGISFYTFHTLSYTIDVYRGNFKPTNDFISFFLFVSIFPLAMAGPIERASNLLPQIYKKRTFDFSQATDGMRQILWGLFKKVVIADNCAVYVNQIFASPQEQTGSTLLLAGVFFAFQIYGDFSGYSDMAIGIGKLLGFKFLNNFRFPYFSRDIAEFWRRWHISLNTWFRDYLYIPLGGSRGSKTMVIRNTFIIFIVSGFWHGANWTFILWGIYHAVLFMPLILLNRNRKHTNIVAENNTFPSFKEVFQIFSTFFFVVIGWIFFRAETIGDAFFSMKKIFSSSIIESPDFDDLYLIALLMVIIMFIFEWFGRHGNHALENLKNRKIAFRWFVYFLIAFLIFAFRGQSETFIYFQF